MSEEAKVTPNDDFIRNVIAMVTRPKRDQKRDQSAFTTLWNLPNYCVAAAFGGAEGQNRTVDTSLFRAVLCQLSYLGTSGKSGTDTGLIVENQVRRARGAVTPTSQ